MAEKGSRLTNESQTFQDDVVNELTPLGGVTSRKMFGGFGIFHDGSMFALISKTSLFFKVDDTNLADFEKAGSRQHRPMPYYEVPESVVASRATLHRWARKAIVVARAAGGGKKKAAATKKK